MVINAKSINSYQNKQSTDKNAVRDSIMIKSENTKLQ